MSSSDEDEDEEDDDGYTNDEGREGKVYTIDNRYPTD